MTDFLLDSGEPGVTLAFGGKFALHSGKLALCIGLDGLGGIGIGLGDTAGFLPLAGDLADTGFEASHNRALRHGLIEYILWQVNGDRFRDRLYAELEPLVLSLCGDQADHDFLASLRDHTSRLVAVRAAAALARLGGAPQPSPFDPLPRDGTTITAATQALAMSGGNDCRARTWLQDAAVERLIHSTIQQVERDFCAQYEREWRQEEEMHLASLLTRLEMAIKSVNGIATALVPHGLGKAPRIDFSFRPVPKKEEGDTGVGSKTYSVDVAFIIQVADGGTPVIKRASIVQCKKLNSSDEGVWRKSFDVKRNQCDDIIQQTDSSFYMFLSPSFIGHEVWITPARLVRNLMDLSDTAGTLPHAPTYFASRSLAHWITYDLFGLWTGDEQTDVVNKAEGRGDHGYSPRFVVRITIHRNSTHEGESLAQG